MHDTPARPRRARALALALLLLPALATAAEPAWLTEARAREAAPVEPKPFRSVDGALAGRVPAKLSGDVVLEDDAYYLELDIGTGTPISCEVLVEGFDIARMLRSTAALSFEQLAKAQGEIDGRTVERLDAGAFGALPWIALDWLYRVKTPEGPMLGALKQVVVDLRPHALYCSHVELGYSRTFATVVEGLARSLEYAGAAQPPGYLEVVTVRLGDRPVGVVTWTLETDAEGDVRSLLSSSMLVPAGEGVVTAQDASHVQWSTAGGRLINAMHVMSTNDETPLRLELNRTEASDDWRVSGTFMGKPLEASLGPETPATVLAQARQRRALVSGPEPVGKSLDDRAWTSVDPTRLLPTRFTVTGRDAAGRYTATEVTGPLAVDAVIDAATGSSLRMTMTVGPQPLVLERVHVAGSL